MNIHEYDTSQTHSHTHFPSHFSLSLSAFIKYCCLWSVDNLCVVCSLCYVCVSPQLDPPISPLSFIPAAAPTYPMQLYTLKFEPITIQHASTSSLLATYTILKLK